MSNKKNIDYRLRMNLRYGIEAVAQIDQLNAATTQQTPKAEEPDFFNVPEQVKDGYYNKAEHYDAMDSEALKSYKQKVYDVFKAYGPTYDNLVASIIKKGPNFVSARRAEWIKENKIIRNDDEHGQPIRMYDPVNNSWPITWKVVA